MLQLLPITMNCCHSTETTRLYLKWDHETLPSRIKRLYREAQTRRKNRRAGLKRQRWEVCA